MLFAIFIALLVVALVAHELNHGLKMRRYGIQIAEVGLGFLIPGLRRFSISIRTSSFVFKINPILLGAYVEPVDKKAIKALPYSQQAHIAGAGPIANLMMASVLFFVLYILAWALMGFSWELVVRLFIAILFFIIFWKCSRVLSVYVFPVLGLAVAGFLIWSLITFGVGESLIGPIGIVQLGKSAVNISEILVLGFAISLGLGLINLLPIIPLDGGRILLALIERVFCKNKIRFRIPIPSLNLRRFSISLRRLSIPIRISPTVVRNIINVFSLAGIFLLFLLIIVVTHADISQLLQS